MRHVLPVLLGTLLLFILTLAAFSIFQQYQARNYQERMQELAMQNVQLTIEQSEYKNRIGTYQDVEGISDNPAQKTEKIKAVVEKYSQKVDGEVSVFYQNLNNNESFSRNGQKDYYMASLYKIIITLYVLEREKGGELSLIEKVGSPSATLDVALTKIITESNNEYALALATKYGWDEIEKYIEDRFDIDFSFKDELTTNVTTMGNLFQIISEAVTLSDTESKYLLQLLNHQTRLTKLPKYLPKNIYSHNKTGEFEQYSHDAGLFYTPKANYILIFMSKSKKPEATNEQMALMSRDIYQILSN